MTPPPPVLAAAPYATNAGMVLAAARLRYLRPEWATLDCTYGWGVWWRLWKPDRLVTADAAPSAPDVLPVDFTALPFRDHSFPAVVFDPPYKLNGRPSIAVDTRYGVQTVTSRADRHRLMLDGLAECGRVARYVVLAKCADQVNGGQVRWQTHMLIEHGYSLGLYLVDMLHKVDQSGGRPQPARRRADGAPSVQEHARRNLSTLLVFRRTTGRTRL